MPVMFWGRALGYRADGCRDDGANNAAAKGETDSQSWKQHTGNYGTHNAHENVAKQAKASSLH